MMPEIPIIDSHHHLWDANVMQYSLLDGPLRPVKGNYDISVFDAIATRNGIEASICVEASSAGADGRAEIAWLLTQAGKSSVLSGIVMWAPLGSGHAGDYIDEVTGETGGLVKGVRRSFEFGPPEDLRSRGVEVDVRAAGRRGLSVDLVLFEHALPQAFQLARECDGTRFVLDHVGKPRVDRGTREPWRKWMTAIGRLDNVVCKISGLAVEAHNPHWSVGDLRPFLDIARDCFGVERLMFGTDWPVCDLAGGVDRWLEAVETWTEDWTAAERGQFYRENAAAFWGLASRVSGR
jgi:L-fuconolactonase